VVEAAILFFFFFVIFYVSISTVHVMSWFSISWICSCIWTFWTWPGKL